MERMFQNWSGSIVINDVEYNSVKHAESVFKTLSDDIHIILKSSNKSVLKRTTECSDDTQTEYKVTVKQYMTKEASPEFDFMAKWNNNVPMPLRTMTGTKIKETPGMVYMKLHGQAEAVIKCLRCGRQLTNPVSQHYGIGPECITKIPMLMNLDINDVENIKKKMVEVEWTGWIIRSAITECEEVR